MSNDSLNIFGKSLSQAKSKGSAQLFGSPTKKVNIVPNNEKVQLFSPELLADMEEQKKKSDDKIAADKAAAAKAPKRPLYRMYNAEGDLLYVTISPQFQTLRGYHWYWQQALIKVEFFHTRDEQEDAKAVAIANENPKYNRNSY